MKRLLAGLLGILGLALAGRAQAGACTMPTQEASVAVPGHPFSALSMSLNSRGRSAPGVTELPRRSMGCAYIGERQAVALHHHAPCQRNGIRT